MTLHPDDDWSAHDTDTFIGQIGGVQERWRDGSLEVALLTNMRHRNLSGIVHGGVIMALFDRVIGINCRNASPDEPMATATITVNLMRQVRVGDFVEFRCRLRKKGRKAFFGDAEAWVGEKLVATAGGVWMKLH